MLPSPIVKICGIRSLPDVDACIQANIQTVGLNFYSNSPRCLTPTTARSLRQALGPTVRCVGVFVRPQAEEVCAVTKIVGLDAIQIHGADAAYLQALKPLPLPLWLAQNVGTEEDLSLLRLLLRLAQAMNFCVESVLLDAKVEGRQGGTGALAPWPLLRDFPRDIPIILAGGLTPENVTQAIAQVRPQGVDVASGVESRPGEKDVQKVKRFAQHAQHAFRLLALDLL